MLSPKRLFTILRSSASTTISLLNKPQELQPISNDSCAPTVNISRARTLIPVRASTLSTKELFQQHLKAYWEAQFWLKRRFESDPPGSTAPAESPASTTLHWQPSCCVKRLGNDGFNTSATKQSQADGRGQVQGPWKESRRLSSFCGWHLEQGEKRLPVLS